jgi:hypothetical protein
MTEGVGSRFLENMRLKFFPAPINMHIKMSMPLISTRMFPKILRGVLPDVPMSGGTGNSVTFPELGKEYDVRDSGKQERQTEFLCPVIAHLFK